MINTVSGYRDLAIAIIQQAGIDYSVALRDGYIKNGKPEVSKLWDCLAIHIAQKHALKSDDQRRAWTWRKWKKAGVLKHVEEIRLEEIYSEVNSGKKKLMEDILEDMEIEDVETAVSFFKSQGFVELAHFVGINPEAAKKVVYCGKALGGAVARKGRYREWPSRQS